MIQVRNVSLVKEEGNDAIYLVCGGAKLLISSPDEFKVLGFDPKKVQVVPANTLKDLPQKPLSNPATKKQPSSVFFSGADRARRRALMEAEPASIVSFDVLLAGWVVEAGHPGPHKHCWLEEQATGQSWETVSEDFIFDFTVDPDFVSRMYGPNGLSTKLNGVKMAGNIPSPGHEMRMDDISPTDGTSRGIDINSFALVGAWKGAKIHGELNCWHVTGNQNLGTRWWDGREKAPDGWISKDLCAMDAQYGAFWPFDPEHPDGSDQPAFKAGDYILVRGVLWQDQPHEGTYDRVDNWDRGPTEGHAAWLEIHPPDWIVRLDPPVPGLRKTVLTMSLITDHWETRDKIEEWVTDEFPDFDVRYPAFEVSSGNEKKKQVLKVRDVEELVDGRFTDLPTVWKHFILDMRDHARVEAGVRHSGSTKRQGRFKGAYLMAWEVPAPAASSLEPDADRLDVAVRGSDDGIWYQRWSGSGVSWGPAHPNWLPLGGDMTSDPAVVAMLPSLVYVFARGSDKALWFKWLTFPDKDKVQHSEWQSLGGVLTSAPAACSPGPDRLDVFARGADNNAMHHQWFDGKKWSGWHPLGGYGTSDPAAAAVGGTPWVFVRGADDAIYYMFVHDEVSGSGWQKLDCVATSAPAACSLAPDQDRLDVFVRASDNALWRRVFDGLGWSGWESLGGVWTSDPAVVAVGGNAWTLARGTDNALHFRIVSTTTPVTAWQWLAGETP